MDHIPDDLLDLQSRFVQWRANRKCLFRGAAYL